MFIQFLEIVCPNPTATVETLSRLHRASFEGPVEHFGNAYVASLADGCRISVRAPMHESEVPVTRPYFRCGDIHAAVKEVEARGGTLMHAPLELPGEGTFAIYMENDIQFGLWEI